MKDKLKIRPATMHDILRWYKETGQEYPGWSMRAITTEHNGKLLGLTGVYYQGKGNLPVAFSDMTPELSKHKKIIARAARMVMRMIEERGIPTLALCDTESGRKFCEKIGFKLSMEEAGKGSVMIWQPQFRT